MPLQSAARNNAELCDLVCATLGITGTFATDAWTSSQRTPPLYPDAVTLEPEVSVPELLARIDTGPGCSVKDSFADLDLTDHRFEILFRAEWIERPPQAGGDAGPERLRWTSASGEDEVVKLDCYNDRRLVAGAWLNRSAGVVGVSNIDASEASLDDVWPGLLAATTVRFPGLPIVGYESGAELDAALHHGFTSLGPLRVWIKPD